MNIENQHIALAQFHGWHYQPYGRGVRVTAPRGVVPVWTSGDKDTNSIDWPIIDGKTVEDEWRRIVKECGPNYTEDLNALHLLEKKLSLDQRNVYQAWISVIVDQKPGVRNWCFLNATAKQKREAILRTIGKWINA